MIEIGGHKFPNPTSAGAFFKAMLARYAPGDRVDAADFPVLLALLVRHPDAAHKIGCGIVAFEVRRNGRTRGFWLIREDGTETDFSYPKCINGAPPVKRPVVQALRYIVSADVRAARDAKFADSVGNRVPCAETGEMLNVWEGHMDHRPPRLFDVIVEEFLTQEGLAFEVIEIVTGRDGQMVPELVDRALGERFRDYHNRVADLAFVKASVNLSMGSRPRPSTRS